MRKVSREAAYSFRNNVKYSSKNTIVIVYGAETHLVLHGNIIAKTIGENIYINHCGWKTTTTRDRLNAFANVNIRIFKGDFILNEKINMIKGWYNIKTLEYHEYM